MKNRTVVILIAVALLTGLTACGKEAPHKEESTAALSTVENLFTSATEPTTTEFQEEAESQTPPELQDIFFSHGFEETELVYNGGELHVPFHFKGTLGMNVGYLLILDGQPQAYKLSEDGEYSYMHTLTVKKGIAVFEFIFKPERGKAGEVLELCVANILDPGHRIGESGALGSKHTNGSMPVTTTVAFQQAPAAEDFPTVNSRIISLEAEYAEVTAQDISGWSDEDLRNRSEFSLSVNGSKVKGTYWGSAPEEPICVHLELWGNPDAKFGLLFYLNGQPVAINLEDLLVHNEQGKKLIFDLELDKSDLQEEAVLYVMIVHRNLLQLDNGRLTWFTEGQTYHFIPMEKP